MKTKIKSLGIFLIMFILLQYLASLILLKTPFGEINEKLCNQCGARKIIRDARYVHYHWLGFKTVKITKNENCDHSWQDSKAYHHDGFIPKSYFWAIKLSWLSLLVFFLIFLHAIFVSIVNSFKNRNE